MDVVPHCKCLYAFLPLYLIVRSATQAFTACQQRHPEVDRRRDNHDRHAQNRILSFSIPVSAIDADVWV